MRLQNKAIATVAALSMALTSFVSVYAAPTATTTITNGKNTSSESITIAAGDVVTVKTTFDSLAGYSGYQYEVYSDATAFSAVEGDNTNYNFGTAKKPVYLPNYLLEELISSRMDETHVTLLIDDFKYSFNDGVGRIMGTSSEGYEIKAADEAAEMYPDNALGINFVANNDIKAGTYEFEVAIKVTTAAGVKTTLDSKKVTAVVEGSSEPTDPKGTVIQGADVIYAGSANAADINAATKFQIEYTGSNESITQPDGTKVKAIIRTAEDILGGVFGEGSLTGTVHFGVKVPASVVGTEDAKHFQINVIND
jgi:hypothetical protein